MTSRKRELFLAVLLSACVLNHSLEADKAHSRKSLHDVEEDFFPEDNLDDKGSENNRKLQKRIVTWNSSQKQKGLGNVVPTTREPPTQKHLNQQRNGSFDADWFTQFTPGQGLRSQGQLAKPNENSKWKPARGHNEFNGQGIHSKEEDEWYEGISSESTKPRKERLPSKPADSSNTVAKYDPKKGVQCPTPDSTGVFVYPPDCKFYVTCDNGRAFVQPCAPGTLFSPESLECDFPDKVKCYGGELADFSSNFDGVSEALTSQDSARYESQKEPTCPPGMSGLLPHPSDCTKFLQCANGQTYIMDCGDGTVFNPMLSICDWPQNVPGCEDAVPSEGPGSDDDGEYSNPSVPHTDYDYTGTADFHGSPKPTQGTRRTAKAIECPPDYSGLHPHPETCEKFLQCANGKTYVMNCGPGTVFNPLTTVCDWPYNVPECAGQNSSPDPSPNYQPTNYGQSNFQGKPTVHPIGSTNTPSGHGQSNSNVRPTHTWIRPGYQGQNNQGGFNAAGSNQDSTWTTQQGHAQQGGFNAAANNQGTSWNNQQGNHQGAAWSPQGYNPQGNQWLNQQGHSTQGSFGTAENSQGSQWLNQQGHSPQGSFGAAGSSQGSQWLNQQGHSPQGSFGAAGSSQGSQWHNQQGHSAQGSFEAVGSSQGSQWHNQHGHNQQGSFGTSGSSQAEPSWSNQGHNQQGLPTNPLNGPSLNHQNHNQQGYPGGPVNHWHDQGSGYYGSPTGTYPDSQYQGSSHNTQHPPQGSWTHTENQSSGNHEHNHTHQQHHEHQQQHSHHYKQHYHPHHTHHHPHHHNLGDVENSTSGQGFPQQSQSGQVHPHHPWQQQENQDSYSNYNHPVQPGYNFNGHGYPYNSQGPSQSQPKPMNFPTDSNASSEEENPSARPNQGQAWTEPAGRLPTSGPQSGKPTWAPTDRRNHSRTHDKGQYDITDIDVRWSAPETANPQSGSFKPSTWRGMGPGFEQRPSYPGRGQSGPTTGGPNTVITNDKPYERPTNPNIYNSNNGQWTPNTNPTGAPNRSGLALDPSYNKTDLNPSRFYGSTNGTRGHFITKDVLIDQGHSKTRQQNAGVPQRGDSGVSVGRELSPSETQYVMVIPSSRKTTTQAPRTNYPDQMNITVETAVLVGQPNNESPELLNSEERNREFIYVRTPADTSSPTVSIELEEDWNSSVPIPTNKPRWNRFPKEKKFETNDENQQSTEIEDLNVEVETADENNQWKPQLVFPDKTKSKPKDDKSVIMRVNNKKPNYLSDVELGPFLDDEPPFPVHYSPPIKSSSLVLDSPKPGQHTPLAGQVIRLRGGTVPSEGYVEVQGKQPGWGVVCDSEGEWSIKEAHVVCKQLGYGRGAALASQGRPKTSQVPTWIAANSVVCTGNETKFQFCKFTHKQECKVEYDAIAVRCLPHRVAHCRNDELAHDGQCYYFGEPTQALNHAEAHDYCHDRGSRLLDIIDQRENDFISEMLLQSQPQVDSVITSGIGFTTLNRTIWMWEDSNVAKFKYTKWWPGWSEDKKSSPFAGTRPVCIIMKKKFPCHDRPENHCKTDYFFWDVEDCATSNKGHSFICERPYDDVGCVYGNGNQYYGNASVSATGRQCLNWSDTQVTRSLMSKVPNKEARDKLKSHNFCRNPNPNKESRPWCFTGPRGEYEYCDIPYCGRILSKKSHLTGSCKPKHFECTPGECIPSPWVCDGEEDCTNGADERKCSSHINFFKKMTKHRLDGYEVEKWLNTPAKTCALRCKEADFTCRSFTHQADGNVCYLSDSNIGMTGALVESSEHDYYEMRDHTLDCEDMFVCANQKCVNKTKVCDGKNDCNDRSDEKICTAENLDYGLRLSGANSSHEGRIEVKILGKWGQVCDDSFDMIDAGVICRELGFSLGALEVRPGGFYGNLDPPEAFMVDQLKCRGNESTLRDCDFEGWGKHNCEPEEAVGVVCKTDIDTCQEGQWKCDNSPMCIPTPFICDEVSDCPDGSDESPQHCDAPFELRLVNGSSHMEGRVEIRHHGIWGTVCDDDFSNATAKVICRSLGFGGPAMVKKDGFFGSGTGPIWLDEVFCYGNETQLYKCEHDHWGRHNCDHNEDAGVICSAGPIPPEYESSGGESPAPASALPELDVNDLLPTECGKRPEDFDEDDELMFEKVVRSSVAPRGSYPWQASIRVRGHSRSSHWCGAVVLSPLHVLTAAHCLEGYNKGTYFVRAGDYNTEMKHLFSLLAVMALTIVATVLAAPDYGHYNFETKQSHQKNYPPQHDYYHYKSPPHDYHKHNYQKPQPQVKECKLAPPTKTEKPKKPAPTPKPTTTTTTTTTTTEAPKKSKKEELLKQVIKKMKDKY